MELGGDDARDGRTNRTATIGGPALADSHRTDLALGVTECQVQV